MQEAEFKDLIRAAQPYYQADLAATQAGENRVLKAMTAARQRESEKLDHHLLELPLSVVVYRWFIIRLKLHPWRWLLPASLALSWLGQSLLLRFNLWQLLTH